MSKQRHAFTLIEILIVVVILGILASIVIPQFSKMTGDAQAETTYSEVQKLRRHVGVFKARNSNSLPSVLAGDGTWGELVSNGGEYLTAPPVNQWVGGDNSMSSSSATDPILPYHTNYGWIYDPLTGDVWAASFDANDEPFPARNPAGNSRAPSEAAFEQACNSFAVFSVGAAAVATAGVFMMPWLTETMGRAAGATVKVQLEQLRSMIRNYQVSHSGQAPITPGAGSEAWRTFLEIGALPEPPVNAVVGPGCGSSVIFGTGPDSGFHQDYGWIFNPKTGEIWAAACDESGTPLEDTEASEE